MISCSKHYYCDFTVDPDDTTARSTAHSMFTIEFYQQFFNVDTAMVLDRIASSMIPKRAPVNYLKEQIGSNPDLYGPFWIVVTLVRSISCVDCVHQYSLHHSHSPPQIFSIAISGNLANYLQEASRHFVWRYNFHLVSIAATSIITYVCLMPIGLWAAFKWFAVAEESSLEEVRSSVHRKKQYIIELIEIVSLPKGWRTNDTKPPHTHLCVRLLAGHLRSSLRSMGNSNFAAAMATGTDCCISLRFRIDNCAQSGSTPITEIGHFDFGHIGCTFPTRHRFHVVLFP